MGAIATGQGPSVGDDPDTQAVAAGRLRRVLCLATSVMLAFSWPLWVEPVAFPRVPFAPRLAPHSAAVSWILFAGLLGSLAAATAGFRWRTSLGVSLGVLAFLILLDQERFQAWVYQYALVALFLATMPDGQALAMSRWWYVATYAYSGLSKLDVSFCRELGGRFLEVAARPLGLVPADWPLAARDAAILAMPTWEVALALALSVPATRRGGRVGAVVLHVALVLILGPWGMGHSAIVLIWNAAMMAEVWVAFGPAARPRQATGRAPDATPTAWLARAAFAVGVVLPLGERRGYCDAWPGHALYASHVERTEVFLHEDELSRYPPEVRRHARGAGIGPWHRLDLTAWSRAARGVPVSPQARACNGLAEALAMGALDQELIRVVHRGRADRWTGRRTEVALIGLDQVRRHGDRYRLNAHPIKGFGIARSPGDGGRGRGIVGHPHGDD